MSLKIFGRIWLILTTWTLLFKKFFLIFETRLMSLSSKNHPLIFTRPTHRYDHGDIGNKDRRVIWFFYDFRNCVSPRSWSRAKRVWKKGRSSANARQGDYTTAYYGVPTRALAARGFISFNIAIKPSGTQPRIIT